MASSVGAPAGCPRTGLGNTGVAFCPDTGNPCAFVHVKCAGKLRQTEMPQAKQAFLHLTTLRAVLLRCLLTLVLPELQAGIRCAPR